MFENVVLFLSAAIAGAVNSVAGGGTLLTFPSLVWAGLAEKVANATSTVALWPGSIGGMWGYRRELLECDRRLWMLVIPSALGGGVGAALLRATPAPTFKLIVPYLILFATVLFMLQEPIARWLQRRASAVQPETSALPPTTKSWFRLAGVAVLQILIALYGGYFGAGIGILMLSSLSLLGLANIHQMNGLKTLFATCINGVAAGYFVLRGMADWPKASLMIVGAIAGGYAGASIARKLGQRTVRRLVICIGVAIAMRMLWQQFA